jgi:hypothetical protein
VPLKSIWTTLVTLWKMGAGRSAQGERRTLRPPSLSRHEDRQTDLAEENTSSFDGAGRADTHDLYLRIHFIFN